MSMLMKIFRPTEQTLFHIDYEWFDQKGQDVNVLIDKCLTPDQIAQLGESRHSNPVDVIDDQTGEVRREDAVLRLLRSEYAKDPNFITRRTPVFEAAFRIFLVNNNQPLTSIELAKLMSRRPSEVLTQLSGRVVYNGIKPVG
jgi:hypothetical protein